MVSEVVSSVLPEAAERLSAKELLHQRKQAYQRTFPRNLSVEAVLSDLAQFCRASKSTYHPDPRTHALLEGRREVWLRIAEHLSMSEDELFDKYVRGK